jgi:formylglycine-generating enzyme
MRLALVVVVGACGRIGFGEAPPNQAAEAALPDADPSPIVHGGVYFRTYDVAGDNVSGDMSHPATVSSFRLDRFQITVGRFRAFVAAGMGTQLTPPAAGAGAHTSIPGSGWDASWNSSLVGDTAALTVALGGCGTTSHTWTDGPAENEDRPIDCITWYETFAFCIWDGGYLPTDAEWNYATAGGDEQRAYPWSSPPDSLTFDPSYASYECLGDMTGGCALTDLTVDGSKPAGNGRYGQSDLGGNVYEWLLDLATGTSFVDPCTDCASLGAGVQRYARGGSYRDDHGAMRTTGRSQFDATVRADVFGARCARSM